MTEAREAVSSNGAGDRCLASRRDSFRPRQRAIRGPIQSIVSNGGEVDCARLLSPRTIELIFDQQSEGVDLTVGVPARFVLRRRLAGSHAAAACGGRQRDGGSVAAGGDVGLALLGLSRQDVNLDGGTARIRQALQY